jgi:hypothetical protein
VKITIELEVREGDAMNSMTEEDWKSLNGRRVVSVGICEKHGTATLILSDDEAPHSADIYQNLMCLADGMRDILENVSKRARARGQL